MQKRFAEEVCRRDLLSIGLIFFSVPDKPVRERGIGRDSSGTNIVDGGVFCNCRACASNWRESSTALALAVARRTSDEYRTGRKADAGHISLEEVRLLVDVHTHRSTQGDEVHASLPRICSAVVDCWTCCLSYILLASVREKKNLVD